MRTHLMPTLFSLPAVRWSFSTVITLATLALLLTLSGAVGFPAVSSGQEPSAPAKKKKSDINFRTPEREYQTVKRGKWTFEVEQQLITDSPAVAQKALVRLQENLDEAFRLLPKPAHPVLKELKYYVLYGPKGRSEGYDNGLEYFSNNAPKLRNKLDERWSRCIVVYHAENYVKLSNLWALKAVLHELGHAHQIEHWAADQPDIMAAWKNAVDTGLYVNVREDTGKTIPKAYALTNQLEYFAELTAIYFAKCNYTPYDRAALKKYDPKGFALIQKMWGLSKADPAPAATKEAPSATKGDK